ncbi:hypothetical protein GCM10020295_78920 [Streptomyces cinereospinus]
MCTSTSFPPAYQAFLDARGISTGGLAPVWGEDLALRAMDAHGVATGILSLSVPGVRFEGVMSRRGNWPAGSTSSGPGWPRGVMTGSASSRR